MSNESQTPVKKQGLFAESLYRNNRQIRKDRADGIIDDVEIQYRRHIEDLESKIRRMKRDQDALIDLNPGSKDSLTFPQLDPEAFVTSDSKLVLDIWNSERLLGRLKMRYAELFEGTEPSSPSETAE